MKKFPSDSSKSYSGFILSISSYLLYRLLNTLGGVKFEMEEITSRLHGENHADKD